MQIRHDFGGECGSGRWILTTDNGEERVYDGREASALSLLLARKVDPRVVINAAFGR